MTNLAFSMTAAFMSFSQPFAVLSSHVMVINVHTAANICDCCGRDLDEWKHADGLFVFCDDCESKGHEWRMSRMDPDGDGVVQGSYLIELMEKHDALSRPPR